MSFLRGRNRFYNLQSESRLSIAPSTISQASYSTEVISESDAGKALGLLQMKYPGGQGGFKRRRGFTYEEVNSVLSDCIESRELARPGIVRALLSYDHDINFWVREKDGVLGRLGRKESQRNGIVQRATMARNCPLAVWKLLIEAADEVTLSQAFNIAVQNNMVAKVDLCLQVAAAKEGYLNVPAAITSVLELHPQENSGLSSIRLILTLLKWINAHVGSKDAINAKAAEEAGQMAVSELLRHNWASLSWNTANPSFDIQQPGIAEGVPQVFHDKRFLSETSQGFKEPCNKYLELLTTSNIVITKSTSAILLGDLLHRSSDNADWLPGKALEVVGYLLSNSGYCPEVEAALIRALGSTDRSKPKGYIDAAELLAHSALKTTFNLALDSMTLGPQLRRDDLWQLRFLVEWGATGKSVHFALCLGLYEQSRNPVANCHFDDFIQALVSTDLDVNFEEGEVVRVAADCGNANILGRLLTLGASDETKSFAFAVAILAQHQEKVLLELINQFNTSKSESVRSYLQPPTWYYPHLFVSLQLYPNSPDLVEALIKIGCPVDAEIEYCVDGRNTEQITPLMFSLCQMADSNGNQRISPEVIDILINKSNINFETKTSGVTPLILAAKYQRWNIVAKLLKKRAKTSTKDSLERSALFYASRFGDLTSVKLLLKAQSPLNDGSLHEAARELHTEVVEVLIKAGHNVNFTSTNNDHGHRTALHEMLLKCKGTTGQIEETLCKLTEANFSDEDFFVALHNPFQDPQFLALVKALLRTGMGELRDSETGQGNLIKKVVINQFEWYYSPTIYLRHGLAGLKVELRDSLSNFLVASGGVDQFSARYGIRQPQGYIAVESVQKAEEDRIFADMSARISARESDSKSSSISLKQREKIKMEVKQEVEQENKRFADQERNALEQLRREAEWKRSSIEGEAQNAKQLHDDLETARLQRQAAINWKIQRGMAADRRKEQEDKLVEERLSSFLHGVDTFSEQDQRLAGWVS
ncbi:hypothetical protein BP6252_13276 [Coleophoma cylindrospora]|uniref:Uncharacterized protein n=1 Tax=Coleophoma cylindrospora TaxID=1849047 RepID=A0A3D8QAX8_9HELO|nr:hypothetical protein BP6252_13276 [Coleophoma cylindrospora]